MMPTSKSKNNSKPIIGITLGDAAGIGPEITEKALNDPLIASQAHYLLIGDAAALNPAKVPCVRFLDLKLLSVKDITPGSPNNKCALASLEFLKKGIELIKNGNIKALVTAPLSKEGVSSLGKKFQGHTEYLADAFRVTNYEMMFYSQRIRTIVITRHIPLKDVSAALTTPKILQTISLADMTLKNQFKIQNPRIAVCGLNPHAGEGGSIGTEELTVITPAIQEARARGIDVSGPHAADTIFSPDASRSYDLIISMYHDQGTIPVKTMAFNEIVNVTIGLPFIRTSPAHGTAFNIAGKNLADPSSMKEAIKLAAKLAS